VSLKIESTAKIEIVFETKVQVAVYSLANTYAIFFKESL